MHSQSATRVFKKRRVTNEARKLPIRSGRLVSSVELVRTYQNVLAPFVDMDSRHTHFNIARLLLAS